MSHLDTKKKMPLSNKQMHLFPKMNQDYLAAKILTHFKHEHSEIYFNAFAAEVWLGDKITATLASGKKENAENMMKVQVALLDLLQENDELRGAVVRMKNMQVGYFSQIMEYAKKLEEAEKEINNLKATIKALSDEN